MPVNGASSLTADGPQNAVRAQEPLLDAHAAGELLGVPHTWLLREARADRVPHRRLGKYVRWSAGDLDWIIESMASGPRTGNGPAQRRRNAR
jgi:hypothetical protein